MPLEGTHRGVMDQFLRMLMKKVVPLLLFSSSVSFLCLTYPSLFRNYAMPMLSWRGGTKPLFIFHFLHDSERTKEVSCPLPELQLSD